MTMIHKILKMEMSPVADELMPLGNAIEDVTDAVRMAWEIYQSTSVTHDINAYMIAQRGGYVVLAKSRGFNPKEGKIGWGVFVISDSEFDIIEALDMGERDEALCRLCELPSDEWGWWSKHF